jgi:hypothetical protein
MQKIFLSAIVLLFGVILLAPGRVYAGVVESGELIKASGAAVYYYFDGKRYVFPNEDVYFSWYENFDTVHTISDSALAMVPIGGNVTIRPGTVAIKITTDPKVYGIFEDNQLRWIANEDVAKSVYGDDWAKKVRDVSDALFLNYEMGEVYDTIKEETDALVTDLAASRLKHPNYSSILNNFIDSKNIGNITSFLHPENIMVISTVKTGYTASTTLSLEEAVNFFTSNSGDWQLRYDYTHNHASGTARLMNYTKTHTDKTFSHRSLFISNETGDQFCELMFQEITYPKDYLAYPNAATFEYAMGDNDLRHVAITNVSKNEISDWYKTVGETVGWDGYQEQQDLLGIFDYYKVYNKDLSRTMKHLYLNTTFIPNLDGLMIFGTEYGKTISY